MIIRKTQDITPAVKYPTVADNLFDNIKYVNIINVFSICSELDK